MLFSDDLKREPGMTVNRVLAFLGLEPRSFDMYPPVYVQEYCADTTDRDEIRRYAGELFEKDKQELKDIYGLDVPW